MFIGFIADAFGDLFNQGCKLQWMSKGRLKMPVVLRGCVGVAGANGAHHSGNYYPFFMHIPGLHVVLPTTEVVMPRLGRNMEFGSLGTWCKQDGDQVTAGEILCSPWMGTKPRRTWRRWRAVYLSLTFDHRLVDGAPAARFLQTVKRYVEHLPLWVAELR